MGRSGSLAPASGMRWRLVAMHPVLVERYRWRGPARKDQGSRYSKIRDVKSDFRGQNGSGQVKSGVLPWFEGQRYARPIFPTKWESACASELPIRIRSVM